MAHGDLRFVSRVCHFLGFNNGHQAASSTFLFNQTISVVCGFVMFFFPLFLFLNGAKKDCLCLSVLVYIVCVYILQASGSTLYCQSCRRLCMQELLVPTGRLKAQQH